MTKQEIVNFVKSVRQQQDTNNATKFVAKVDGKGLSTNDYSDAEAGWVAQAIQATSNGSTFMTQTQSNKLTNIAENAQVNVIESVSVNNAALTVTDKGVNIDLSNYATKTEVAAGLTYKGSVDTFAALPASGNSTGDMYNVKIAGGTDRHGTAIKAGDNVAYVVAGDGDTVASGWDVLGGTTDLSGYVQTETGKALSTNDFTNDYKDAVDALVSGAAETFTAEDLASVFVDDAGGN